MTDLSTARLEDLLGKATSRKVSAGVIHHSDEYVQLQKMGVSLAREVLRLRAREAKLVTALKDCAAVLEIILRNRPQNDSAPTNIAIDVTAKNARAALTETPNASLAQAAGEEE